MRVLNFLRGTLNWRNAVAALTLIVCTLFGNNSAAQIQQAWVARYNNGITNGTSHALSEIKHDQFPSMLTRMHR